MNTDITFIIADNQDITRMGMHGYIPLYSVDVA